MTEAEAAASVGAELQRARESRGLALSEVAQQLKFAPRQLEALEQDRFDLLPGATFARGMVRNYARLLKLDPEPLLKSVGGHYEAPDAGNLAARYSQPVPFSDNARRSTFVYLALSVVVLAIGGGVGWQWYHERNRPATSPLASVENAKPEKADKGDKAEKKVEKTLEPTPKAKAPEPTPKVAQAAVPKAAPADVAPKSAPQPTVEKVVEMKPLPIAKVTAGVHRLVIRCDAEAWIEVRAVEGDRALISSLNPAGAERSVRAHGPLNLVIGNASHVTVLHNGQPLELEPYVKSDIARFTLP
jgi:cytoskeleton protein RodZ